MKKFIYAFILIFALVVTCGCNKRSKKENFSWDNVKFESVEISYDGQEHQIVPEGIVGGATIEITPNKFYKEVGEYDFSAVVTFNGESRNYSAKLTIKQLKIELNCAPEQTVYLSDGPGRAKYDCNFPGYDPDEVEYFMEPGDYETVLVFSETEQFSGFETQEVKLHVEWSRTGYFAEEKYYVVYDFANVPTVEPFVIEDAKVKDSYVAKVVDCDLTVQGIYNAGIAIFDGDSNEAIETFKTIIVVDYIDDPEFVQYETEMFNYFLEGDQISVNIFMEDYEQFGIEHSEAIWYYYEPYSDEDYASDCEEVKRLRDEFNSYSDNKLSYKQINTYENINKTLLNYEELFKDKKNILMQQAYVDQYGGYCADCPTDFEAYSIRRLEDLTDLLSYINSTYDSFMTYFDYIKDRAEAGYGFTEFTLKSFCDYLDGVSRKSDNYYLIEVTKNKVRDAQELLGLTNEQVADYCADIETAFTEKYLKAHKDLSTAVKAYVKEEKKSTGYLYRFKTSYLSSYEGGTILYESILRNRLGMYEKSMSEYIAFLDAEVEKYYNLYFDLYEIMRNDTFANNVADGKKSIVSANNFDSLIAYLKEFAKTIVPDLKTAPTIDVTYMDPTTTANTTTLAYYMKSPIDSTDAEYIHLNESGLASNKLETINTLAHEGYPGHLYAYVYSKESDQISNLCKVMTCTGHGEGWAKYVEAALDRYIIEKKKESNIAEEDKISWERGLTANIYWDAFVYALYARLDVGINYEKWIASEVSKYLSQHGLSASAATDLFNTLIEVPGQYAPYGYGLLTFENLHELAKAELGFFYDEVKFNNCLLEHGWIGLDRLEGYVDDFIKEQKYIYNLD